jgi:hypothetical protein
LGNPAWKKHAMDSADLVSETRRVSNMIYEFTVENFRSFGAAQTLSLIKGKERNKPENLIDGPPGFPKTVRTAAIFGHNASGKSNLFLAAQCVYQTIMFSATGLNPGNAIPGIVPHRLDAQWASKPTRFEVVFSMGSRIFRYGFSATSQAITAEKLVEEFSTGKSKPLFERKFRTQGDGANVEFSDAFDNATKDNVPRLTRDNALLLSSGANLNVPLLREIYTHIVKGVAMVLFSPSGPTQALLAKSIQENEPFRGQLRSILRDADIGITNLRVEPPPEPSPAEIEPLRQAFAPQHGERAGEVALAFARQRKPGAILSEHLRTDGASVEFGWNDESQGTRLSAQLFYLFTQALQQGSVIFIDEFGSNIHPLLAQRLIELFQNPESNRNGAQLIFTTHYSQLMTPELFRKDQIWITAKTPQGQTELFSLSDFRSDKYTRSSEAFEKNYLEGRYRGVGNFGPTLSGVPLEPSDNQGGSAKP